MEFWQAVVLGVVEGVTEFLPVSSTGHMVLVSHVMGIANNNFVKTFEIVIQLGALAAVAAEYGKRFLNEKQLIKKVVITFVPTGIIGVLVYGVVKQYLLGSAAVTVAALVIGGVVIIGLERFVLANQDRDNDGFGIDDLSLKKCFILGCLQAGAVIPGVSRAAMTIIGGMWLGLSRREATEFSFLVAAPTLLAASGLDLVKSGIKYSTAEIILIGVGFVTAFGVAWVVVKWLLGYLKTHTFEPFGWYRIGLGIVYALVFLV